MKKNSKVPIEDEHIHLLHRTYSLCLTQKQALVCCFDVNTLLESIQLRCLPPACTVHACFFNSHQTSTLMWTGLPVLATRCQYFWGKGWGLYSDVSGPEEEQDRGVLYSELTCTEGGGRSCTIMVSGGGLYSDVSFSEQVEFGSYVKRRVGSCAVRSDAS